MRHGRPRSRHGGRAASSARSSCSLLAYSALPMRISVISIRRTIAASTFSRGRPRRFRSASTRARISGRARAKVSSLVVFRLVAHLAPARMIAVLLAPARVAAGGLQVAVRVGADPHLGPGRRDRQRADAPQRLGIADRRAVRADGSRSRFSRMAGYAGRGVADIAQPRALRRDLRIQRLRERRVAIARPVLLFSWRYCCCRGGTVDRPDPFRNEPTSGAATALLADDFGGSVEPGCA